MPILLNFNPRALLTLSTPPPPSAPPARPASGNLTLRNPTLNPGSLLPSFTLPVPRLSPTQAAPAASRPVDEWIKTAIENNPDLIRARNLIQNSELFAGLMSRQDFSFFFGNPPSNASWSANEWRTYVQGKDPGQIINTMALRWTLYSGKNRAAKEVAMADVMLATVSYQEKVLQLSRYIQLNVNEGLKFANEIESTKTQIASYRRQIADFQKLSTAGVILPDEVQSLQAQLSAAESKLQTLETQQLDRTHELARLVGEEPEALAELPVLRQRSNTMANLSNAPLATRLAAMLPDTPANLTPLNGLANSPTNIYNSWSARGILPQRPAEVFPVLNGGWALRNSDPPPLVGNIDRRRLPLLLNSALQTAQGRPPSPKLLQQLAMLFPQFFPQALNPASGGGVSIAARGSLRGLLGTDAIDTSSLVSNLLAVSETQEGINRLNQAFALPVRQKGVVSARRASPNDMRNIDIGSLRAELNTLMQNGQGGTQRAQQLAVINYQYALLRHAGARGEVSLQFNPLALAFGGAGLAQTVLGNLFGTALSFTDSRQRRADIQIARAKLEQSILQAFKSGDDDTRAIKRTLVTISGNQPGSTRAGWTSAYNELITSANRLAAIRYAVTEAGTLAPHVKHPSYGMNLYEAHRDTVKKMEALANYGHIAYFPRRLDLMARVGGLLDPRTNRVDPTANLLDGLFAQGANRAARRMTFPALL